MVAKHLVIFTKTEQNLRYFLFYETPFFLSIKYPIIQRIASAIPNAKNIVQKIFNDILVKICEENLKCYTPLLGAIGAVFEINRKNVF